MEEMGYGPSTTTIRGGTVEGHKRLAVFLDDAPYPPGQTGCLLISGLRFFPISIE
jgi:hypothetical protein